MAQTIDSELRRRRRGRFPLIALAVVVLVAVLGGKTALSYYVDSLWFGSLGYVDVFFKTLRLESTVFLVFAAATFLILYGSFQAMWHGAGNYLPGGHTVYVGGQALTLPVDPVMRFLAIGGSLFVALISGSVMLSNWPSFALYWYAPAGLSQIVDPIFHKPLNFYLFTLPVWQLISGWLIVLAVIVSAVATVFLVVGSGARALAARRGKYIPAPSAALSIPFAFLLLVIALRVYFGRFDYLFEDHTILAGVTYADAHVLIPGLFVVCVALVIGAALIAATTFSAARVRWLVVSVVPAAVCYLALQGVAWYVTSFVVKPNQLVRERPYIAHNIELTRAAFALDRVTQREFPAETTVDAVEPAKNQATLQNIRLWDWRALQDTLRQIQEIRTYYDFPDIDIDRYDLDGNLRQVMLATRELNIEKLPESSRNWINEKLIYTHGYGVTMNPVNGFTPEGLPTLILSNMPVQSTVRSIAVTRPEIYFGELTNTDVYVNTRQKEFNYPQGATNSLTSYEGKGGIVVGGFFRRILLAFERGDIAKVPFSDDINSQSRLLMRRNLRERVAALAPFLTFDSDPYIVVGNDGRLSWMMDGFTVSDSYPYSRHYRLDQNLVNYMRNSVKVVIDAYDGTTTFYVFDPGDPIISAYCRIFPTLFKDAAAMPPTLRKHVRYPELLLKLQADVYALYHMTDPEVFYNREDLWTVASEVGMNARGEQGTQEMEPNFVLMRLPGENGVEFVEILPFTPANRNNLIAWIAGRSDGAHYGTLVAYDFPKNRLVDGPLQVEARIDQNAQLSGQLTLWNQQGSQVRRGTLLVIPSGRALLYAEPIYLQAQRSPMPELRLVVLALQDRLAYGPNFESAMAGLFGEAAPSLTMGAAAPQAAAALPPTAPQPSDLNALISQAASALADYQRLTAEGKLGEAGQKLEQLKRTLDELNSRKR
jgi:uncharacterized membrane protein (UPF0182 family)